VIYATLFRVIFLGPESHDFWHFSLMDLDFIKLVSFFFINTVSCYYQIYCEKIINIMNENVEIIIPETKTGSLIFKPPYSYKIEAQRNYSD
jgi:hypothetical protein